LSVILFHMPKYLIYCAGFAIGGGVIVAVSAGGVSCVGGVACSGGVTGVAG
jgi:hypothetical protein